MRGKKARAIRKKHGVKHARLTRPRIEFETKPRGRLLGITQLPFMAISPKHLREHRKAQEDAKSKVKETGKAFRRHSGWEANQGQGNEQG